MISSESILKNLKTHDERTAERGRTPFLLFPAGTEMKDPTKLPAGDGFSGSFKYIQSGLVFSRIYIIIEMSGARKKRKRRNPC